MGKGDKMTFGRAMFIFIISYIVFFFLVSAGNAVFFQPDLSPGNFEIGSIFNNMAVIFLVSIIAVFVVGAILYYIIVTI